MHACFQRISSADARARVGGESNRRRDVRDDAEVEHEHVRSEHRHAHLLQCRCGNGRGDDVVRRRRHAHTEHNRRNHGEEHRRQEHPTCEINQSRCEAQADARLCDDADDDARRRTGDEHAEHALRAALKAVDDLDRLHARRFAQHGAEDGEEDGDECRTHGRIARDEQVDNHDERDREMPALLQERQRIRQLGARDALQLLALCLKVNAEPDPRKVEECGDRRCLDNVDVGNADELRHEERRCAHDRRHELSARGCRRLDRPRKVRVVAEFFHHRDGKRARADNIRDRAARNRAHQSAGEDGDLRRAAARPACDRIGEVDEELAKPRALKIGTEKDEEEDKRRGDTERDAEDALRRKVEVTDQLLRRESAMREHARHVGAEEGIRDECEHDRHHRQPHDAPRRLDDEEDAEPADDGVHG